MQQLIVVCLNLCLYIGVTCAGPYDKASLDEHYIKQIIMVMDAVYQAHHQGLLYVVFGEDMMLDPPYLAVWRQKLVGC